MRHVSILLPFLIVLSGNAYSYERVVTLSPELSEWAAEILGETRAKTIIRGVSEYSDYPLFLKSLPTLGPYHQLQLEKIVVLKPDLVLASEENNDHAQLSRLRDLGIRVEIMPKIRFDSMPEWIERLGQALGEAGGAKRKRAEWSRAVSQLRKHASATRGRRAMIEIQHSPLVVVGGGSFISEAFKVVGVSNVFDGLPQGYPKVSVEAVLRANPEFIFLLDLEGDGKPFREAKQDWDRRRSLAASRAGQIRVLSGSDFSRCTPRLLKALKRLN